MQAFSCWHAYFDSAFLALPLTLKKALHQDLDITCRIGPWPHLDLLPELPVMFSKLERFILADANWVGCEVSEEEMLIIEQKLNALLINLQCEKRYAWQFWSGSTRRIQASIVHFFLFFKTAILACIPRDCEDISSANQRNKLIISIPQLQKLVNQILQGIKAAYRFLSQNAFQEEQQFTIQMFEEWIYLLQHLPTLKKSKFMKIPKLMEYICIVNPLETNQASPSENNHIRRRNNTEVQKHQQLQKKDRSADKDNPTKSKNKIEVKCQNLMRSVKWQQPEGPAKSRGSKLVIFKFRDKVRKHSVYISNRKKNTVASIDTRDRTEISKSPHSDHNFSFISSTKPERSETVTNTPLCNSIVVDRKSRGDLKTISEGRKSIIKQMYMDEDCQNERKQKIVKKKGPQIHFRVLSTSEQIKANNGGGRGWGIIRQWFKARVAARKIQKLLSD